jgi:hypothetical protein
VTSTVALYHCHYRLKRKQERCHMMWQLPFAVILLHFSTNETDYLVRWESFLGKIEALECRNLQFPDYGRFSLIIIE